MKILNADLLSLILKMEVRVMKSKKVLGIVVPVAGLIVLAAYFNFAVFGVPIPERLALSLAFAIGPVAIIGILHLRRLLSEVYSGELLNMATVFFVIAFSLLDLMLIVQQAFFAFYQKAMQETTDEPIKESLRLIYSQVNSVQLGIDIAWDIFYCVGAILLSIVLLHLSRSWKLLGTYGLLTVIPLLILNMWTFPVPPDEAGLIDFGPFTAFFWIILIVVMFIHRRKRSASLAMDT